MGKYDQTKKEKSNLQVGLENLGFEFGFKTTCSNLFAGLPLEAEGGSFSPRLSYAAAVVALALQLQCPCPADPQACPALAQQMCHPVVDKTTYCPVLVGYLSKDNTTEPASVCCKFQFGYNLPLGHNCPNVIPTSY